MGGGFLVTDRILCDSIWESYYAEASAVVFVVDASSSENDLEDAKLALRTCSPCVVLLCA
jgi:hypothetical protein